MEADAVHRLILRHHIALKLGPDVIIVNMNRVGVRTVQNPRVTRVKGLPVTRTDSRSSLTFIKQFRFLSILAGLFSIH
jgi:hypothetical protein